MSTTLDKTTINNHSAFIWRIADLLRGSYRAHQYGSTILPFVILRRLDCVLAATKQAVLDKTKISGKIPAAIALPRASGHTFYNTSAYDLGKLAGGPENVKANLIDYVNGFSDNVRDIFAEFDLEKQLAKLDDEGLLYLVTKEFATIDLHPTTVSNADMARSSKN